MAPRQRFIFSVARAWLQAFSRSVARGKGASLARFCFVSDIAAVGPLEQTSVFFDRLGTLCLTVALSVST